MKDKIKVYLQYPWKFPDSPYYKNLISNLPKGLNFSNIEKQRGVITNKHFFWFSNFLKRNIRRVSSFFRLSLPNAHFSPDGDYDLIHCAHCLSKNLEKPWVADIERAFSFSVSGINNRILKRKVKGILMKENCKKILPWTEETKNEILNLFPDVGRKMEVLYPAVSVKNIVKKNSKKIYLIFSGRYFYDKGGLDALEVIDQLTKKYDDVYGIFNSEVPEEILKKYSNNKKIEFYGLISQEKLFELYEKADISIYPGYSDSFGFAYLESMSFGVPIVTVNGFARKEIVEDGFTGFVVEKNKEFSFKRKNKEIIDNLIEKASLLIENKSLRKKMSKNCVKVIKDGKFSIKERNKKLEIIYREALE